MDTLSDPPMYFDMEGIPITLRQWSDAMAISARDLRVIRSEYIGSYFISTVWLGLDHSFDSGPPLIFETMIFDKSGNPDSWSDIYMDRYPTKAEALEGHLKAVEYAKSLG